MLPNALPEPVFFTPGAGEPALRWAILGPGWISGYFVQAVMKHTRQRVVAVGSRSRDRAQAFAHEHGIERGYGSYEELLDDPEVDVVYVATPPSEHLAAGLRAVAAGKHVLVEKPIATTADDARTLLYAARAAGVFAMEAMWSRYQPQSAVIRALLADGVLGEVHTVIADHGQAIPADPTHRLYRRELGGGALLDLGIYPVQLDSMVLGTPTSVTAIGTLTDTGVDAYASLILTHSGVGQSTLSTSLLTCTPTTAVIAGSEARIEMAGPFHIPTRLVVADNEFQGRTLVWDDPTGVQFLDALAWQATALATFVGQGRVESPLHTHHENISIMATLDEARRQVGVTVP